MARIALTPEELRGVASNFTTKSGEMTEMINFLRQQVSSLDGTFEGDAKTAFTTTWEEIAKTLDSVPQLIEGIGSQLNAVANTMENTDNELANQLRGSN